MDGQELVIQFRPRDLQGEPALVHRGGEQHVRAVLLARPPGRGVLPESPVLPDRNNPFCYHMFHLRHRQDGSGLGIRPAVGDVDPGIAGQVLEQQAPKCPERPFAGGLVLRPQHPGGQDVAAQRLLGRDRRPAFVGTAVVGGDGLRGEERQPGDPVPGEVRDDAGGAPRDRAIPSPGPSRPASAAAS